MIRRQDLLTSLVIVGLVCALMVAVAWARAPNEPADSAEPKTLRELMDASIKWYDVYPDAEAKEHAEVLTALRWANNARGSEDGITLLFV